MTRILFDDSLPLFVALVQREWGADAAMRNLFLRDVTGRLTFVVLDANCSPEARATLAEKASIELSPYVDEGGFAVATPAELYDSSLDDHSAARKIALAAHGFHGEVQLVDRRMVGADWLRTPAHAAASGPPRIVFASLKGGVGRSTALCVTAAHLAALGKRVLTIDMDLEAPGLGNMLLPGDTLPNHGLLDYLVEQGLGPLDDEFYVDVVGSSWLGGGRGRVDVIPAIGRRSLDHPANVLGKIARAYLSGAEINGVPLTFADHVSALVDRFSDPFRYDVILVDARAGLHETTAAAVVSLGAEIFFFGIDQPQTYAGYELLLAHLGALPVDREDDWRERIQFVQAKSSPRSHEERDRFADAISTLAKRYLWPLARSAASIDVSPLKDTFEVEWIADVVAEPGVDAADEADVPILEILSDARYVAFDPVSDGSVLEAEHYLPAFGQLIGAAIEILDTTTDNAEGTRP
jgi:hypothetical protein